MTQGQIVGALACQKDSYLRSIEARVVSCVQSPPVQLPSKKSGTSKPASNASTTSATSGVWQIEFTDSVLFPEGGGQPSDHGTVLSLDRSSADSIKIGNVQRHGLSCIYESPEPISPGTLVRQNVDFERRWDHMQQHTGQHLLSAVMNSYDNLQTLGWGMGSGDSPNYVDVPRNVSETEMREIQDKCNEIIRNNLTIAVDTPSETLDDGSSGEHDNEKGVVRVVKIGSLDANACCGTHLRQTSHIGLILLLYTQSVHSKNCRLYFTAGDRAVKLATNSSGGIRSIAKLVSSGSAPLEVVAAVTKLKESAADAKRKETKLLQEIAKYEADRVKAALLSGQNAFVHRTDQNLDFNNTLLFEVKEVLAKCDDLVVVLATGERKMPGQLLVVGNDDAVKTFATRIMDSGIDVKGGGKGGRWQGKIVEWKKDELEILQGLIESPQQASLR